VPTGNATKGKSAKPRKPRKPRKSPGGPTLDPSRSTKEAPLKVGGVTPPRGPLTGGANGGPGPGRPKLVPDGTGRRREFGIRAIVR